MITKRTVPGIISILDDGQIQLRTDTIVEEDGVELSRTYHRKVLEPGVDITNEPQRVRDIIGVIWTQAVIDSYKNARDARINAIVSRG